MRFRSWLHSFRQTFQSLTRSGLMSLASVATVSISLLVLGVIVVLAVNLNLMAASVEAQLEVRAFLYDGTAPATREALLKKVEAIPGVKQVTFISKERGLAAMREQLGEEQSWIVEALESNPLPDSLEIELSDPQRVAEVAQAVQALPEVEKVRYGQGTAEKILAVTRAVRAAGLVLVLLLMVATVLTLSNTIRLAVVARRREIAIMKLVGATDWFIRRPFIMEGILLGLLGAALGTVMVSLGYRYVAQFLVNNLPFLPVVSPVDLIQPLASGLLGLGAFLGIIGSWISVRRFLRV